MLGLGQLNPWKRMDEVPVSDSRFWLREAREMRAMTISSRVPPKQEMRFPCMKPIRNSPKVLPARGASPSGARLEYRFICIAAAREPTKVNKLEQKFYRETWAISAALCLGLFCFGCGAFTKFRDLKLIVWEIYV